MTTYMHARKSLAGVQNFYSQLSPTCYCSSKNSIYHRLGKVAAILDLICGLGIEFCLDLDFGYYVIMRWQ